MELLEEIMDVEEGAIKADMVLEEQEEWDSLSKLSLTLEVKTRFHKNLDIITLKNFVTVQDILDYLG